MADRLRTEQRRVIEALTARADAERRAWPFTAHLFIANVAFALAPLVPRAHRVFGALTGPRAIAITAVCFPPVFVSVYLYRRLGFSSRWYRASEVIETFSLYAISLIFIYSSGVRWSVLWALCPFSALFFALTKPFRRRLYSTLIISSHATLACMFAAGERFVDAAVSVGIGAVALATFSAIARAQRRAVLAEADRNVALAELAEKQLDDERARIASSLASGVMKELAAISDELRAASQGATPALALAVATEQAHAALLELRTITSPTREAALPRSLDELGRLLELRLGALCVNTDYRQRLAGEGSTEIAPATALAVLRIGQELVRNAVTHGAARTVNVQLSQLAHELSLSVTDDGSGLRAERLASATGGLDNVRRWLHERGGRLQRSSPADRSSGTELRVTMPLMP